VKKTTRIRTGNVSPIVRIIGNNYGFTTVGQLYNFLEKCNPLAKISYGTTHMRARKLYLQLKSELFD